MSEGAAAERFTHTSRDAHWNACVESSTTRRKVGYLIDVPLNELKASVQRLDQSERSVGVVNERLPYVWEKLSGKVAVQQNNIEKRKLML